MEWGTCPLSAPFPFSNHAGNIPFVSFGSRIGDVLSTLECDENGVPKVLSAAADGSEIKPEIGKAIVSVIPVDADTNFRWVGNRCCFVDEGGYVSSMNGHFQQSFPRANSRKVKQIPKNTRRAFSREKKSTTPPASAIHQKVRSFRGPGKVDTSDQDLCKPPSYDDYMKYYFPELAVAVEPDNQNPSFLGSWPGKEKLSGLSVTRVIQGTWR